MYALGYDNINIDDNRLLLVIYIDHFHFLQRSRIDLIQVLPINLFQCGTQVSLQ